MYSCCSFEYFASLQVRTGVGLRTWSGLLVLCGEGSVAMGKLTPPPVFPEEKSLLLGGILEAFVVAVGFQTTASRRSSVFSRRLEFLSPFLVVPPEKRTTVS
ncbi:unnamed protein product [Ectocarpus sp. 13 AM-2016]